MEDESSSRVSVKRLSSIFQETTPVAQQRGPTMKQEPISARKLTSLPDMIIEERKTPPPPPSRLKQLAHKASFGGGKINWDLKYSKSPKSNGNYEPEDEEEPDPTKEENIFLDRTGSIVGMRNKVKNTMAILFQSQAQTKSREHVGVEKRKVVVYVTTNGIVRETFHKCLRVKTILTTHRIPFEERNLFVQTCYLKEVRDRLVNSRYSYYEYAGLEWEDEEGEENLANGVPVPQVFVEGRHLGGAERIESLNESGQLKNILKDFKSSSANVVCAYCGNYRVVMCEICKGSKKSPVRNGFSSRNYYFQLRCTNCDENGLVPCKKCSN